MTIASTTNRMPNYVGTSLVSTYSYTFRIFEDSDLLVTVKNLSDVETTLVLDTDYTVDGVGDLGGGSITLVNASQAWLTGGFLTTNFELSIRRVVDLIQETDIRNQGSFFPEAHEDAFDYGVMIAQQQQDEIDRSMKLPESVAGNTFDTVLPATIVGASNSVLVVNSTGDGFTVGSQIADLAALDAAYAGTTANAAAAAASEAAAAAEAVAAAASAAAAVAASTLASTVNIISATVLTSTAKGKIHNITPSASFNITLPAPAVGFYCWFKDVGGNFETYPITLVRAGSETLEGLSSNYVMESKYGIWKIYSDGTNYFLS